MTSGDELRIGISGWRYAGWRGKFYSKGAVAAATRVIWNSPFLARLNAPLRQILDLNVLSGDAMEID